MASGDVVGVFYRLAQPRTSFATPSARTGGSAPNELVPQWDFDDAAVEYLDIYGQMSSRYSGGGVTVQIKWAAKTATTTSGDVVWAAAFREIIEGGDDLDVSQTYDFNSTTSTAPSTNGAIKYAAITFTNGADMDNVGAGDMFILRIARNANLGSDTMAGDSSLIGVVVVET